MNEQRCIGRNSFNQAIERGKIDQRRECMDTPVDRDVNFIPQFDQQGRIPKWKDSWSGYHRSNTLMLSIWDVWGKRSNGVTSFRRYPPLISRPASRASVDGSQEI